MKRRTSLIVAPLFALALSLSFVPTPARAADVPRELRIGYQKIGALLILKQRGSLERRFAGQNITVRWVQFQSGAPLIEALDAGAALRSGSVDAWSIWDPFYALGERFPGVHVLTDADGVAPSNAFFL